MMTRDDAIHMMKEYARSVEPKVTITLQQFDAMRVALEVIAVGDSKTPSDTAAHGLVASGFWTDALETENSNSRAASTSANVAQGAEAMQPLTDAILRRMLKDENRGDTVYRCGYNQAIENVRKILAMRSYLAAPPAQTANVAQGAEAYQYRDVAHWFREIAGARVLNHVLTEMTHSELALRAFSAGRALTAAQSASGDKS